MVISSLSHGMPRDNAQIDNLGFPKDQKFRKPCQHTNVGLVMQEMNLAIFEASCDLGRHRIPCLYLKAWRWINITEKNCVRKTWVLSKPLTNAMEVLLIVQVLYGVELDQISKQQRQLGNDFAKVDRCVRGNRLGHCEKIKDMARKTAQMACPDAQNIFGIYFLALLSLGPVYNHRAAMSVAVRYQLAA